MNIMTAVYLLIAITVLAGWLIAGTAITYHD